MTLIIGDDRVKSLTSAPLVSSVLMPNTPPLAHRVRIDIENYSHASDRPVLITLSVPFRPRADLALCTTVSLYRLADL
jgi:hypothetical protein